jgi:signal transduction histidine kinase
MFFGAVSVVAWQGGWWPGIMAALESAIVADYFLILPGNSWVHDEHTLLRIGLFVLCSALISWLGERQLQSQKQLRKMNWKLAHEHERLKLALSTVNGWAWYWDATTPTAPTSVGDERMADLEFAIFQKRWPGKVHPNDRAHFDEVLHAEVSEPAPFELEYRVIDGEVRWLVTKGQAVTRAKDGPRGLVGVTFDVTGEKRATEALRRSEKLATAGQLSATIAHEINNPLESIWNLIEVAKSTEELPASAKEYLDLAIEEVERVANIARNALGSYRESAAPVDLPMSVVLGMILEIYRKKSLKKHVRLVNEWKESLRFCGLPGELKQIVTNLVSNALDAVQEGGTIFVRARESIHGGLPGIRITVADDGPGIPKETRKRVFDAFFTTKEETGTGLGLWVTKELVSHAGGDIALRSAVTGPHRGTTFSVFIPKVLADVRAVENQRVFQCA